MLVHVQHTLPQTLPLFVQLCYPFPDSIMLRRTYVHPPCERPILRCHIVNKRTCTLSYISKPHVNARDQVAVRSTAADKGPETVSRGAEEVTRLVIPSSQADLTSTAPAEQIQLVKPTQAADTPTKVKERWSETAAFLLTLVTLAATLWPAFLYVWHKTRHIRAYNAIFRGTRPASHVARTASYVERPDAVAQLSGLLEDSIKEKYQMVLGPNGVGKTTAIKEACAQLGQGVIYVHLTLEDTAGDAYQDVATALATTLGIPGVAKEKDGKQAFRQVLGVLQQAAHMYRARHKAPMRLVLDNINALASAPSVVTKLQHFARDCANDDLINVIFVSSPGKVPEIMQSSSARSRLGTIIILPELSDKQAQEYANKLGVPQQHVEQLVTLVGGNFAQLSTYGGRLRRGDSWKRVKHSLYSAAKLDYGKAGLLPDGGGSFSADEQRTILLALQQLYKAPGSSMSFDLFTDMLPKPQMPTYSLLQKMNVVESYDGYTVVFSSKPIAAYLNNVLLAAHGISSDASAARLLQHCCD